MMGRLISLSKHSFSRFLLAIIAAIAAGILVVASAQQSTDSPIPIRVLMSAPDAGNFRFLIDEFNQKNPDLKLEVVEGPNATDQIEYLYSSSFLLGNSPYDLVFMDIVWVPKFAAAGWLSPLSERLSSQANAQLLEGELKGGIYQDKLYRVPFFSNAGMLYYRTDWLEKNGLSSPETFADLLEIAKELQQQGLAEWGYVWQGKQYEGLSAMFVEILKGFGGFWVNPDNLEVGLDRPEAIAAAKFLKETIDEKISPAGVTTYQEEETRRFFQNGKVAFLRNWPYVFRLANEDNSEIKGKFAIKPMVHLPDATSGACQGGWGFGIAKSSRHPDEAWKAIEFMIAADVQKRMTLETGYLPVRRELFNDPEVVARYPHYPELLNILENSVLRPAIAQYAQASDILQRYLSAALTARMSPEAAMQSAARETRALLKRS